MNTQKSDYDAIAKTNSDRKEELICEYHKTIINPLSTTKNIQDSIDNINEFKSSILKSIANNASVATELGLASKTQKTNLENLEEREKRLNKTRGKLLAGTELKQNIYEENTNLTMHMIYYILGIGFMGYYAVRLIKGRN
jgi:hypothetical protein